MGLIFIDDVDFEFLADGPIPEVHSRGICESICLDDIAPVWGMVKLVVGFAQTCASRLEEYDFFDDCFPGVFID